MDRPDQTNATDSTKQQDSEDDVRHPHVDNTVSTMERVATMDTVWLQIEQPTGPMQLVG